MEYGASATASDRGVMSIWQVAFGSAPLLRNQLIRDSDKFIEMANLAVDASLAQSSTHSSSYLQKKTYVR